MEGAAELPRYVIPGARARPYIRVEYPDMSLDREGDFTREERLAREIGPEFDRELYRQQMRELDTYNKAFDDSIYDSLSPGFGDERVARAVHNLNLPYRTVVKTSAIPDEDFEALRESLAAVEESGDYASISEWSDADESGGALSRKGWIRRFGKWGAMLGIPVIAGLGGIGYAYANQNDGIAVYQWDPNTEPDVIAYHLYLIKEDDLHAHPELYNPTQGGDIKKWAMETQLHPKSYKQSLGLEVGRIYLARATALDTEDLESDYSNEVRGIAALRGDIYHSYPSDFRVDGYDWNMYKKAYGQRYESSDFVLTDIDGNGKVENNDFNIILLSDLDGDGDVDRNDGVILRGKMYTVYYGDMGLAYVDENHVPETEF